MTAQPGQLDATRVEEMMGRLFGNLGGAVTSALSWLGDRLGLYRAMQGAGPMTSEELAARTHLSERWVREWLHGQTAAGFLDYDGTSRFTLSDEAAAVLADEDSPTFGAGGLHHLPNLMGEVLLRLPEAFRTGLGLTYDDMGEEAAVGVERLLAPWFRHALVPVALPALDGVVDKLESGALVADMGCGAGIAMLKMAEAFPKSEFRGYDISRFALERAAENLKESGAKNATFCDASVDPMPEDGRFDLITTFDCIHDMAHPSDVIRVIRRAIKPDGTWFIADIHCGANLQENLDSGNPMLPMLYGFSVLCCMSSSLSTPEGEGLGTVGFGEAKARQMTAEAGFSRFQAHDFDNPLNAYYEVRV